MATAACRAGFGNTPIRHPPPCGVLCRIPMHGMV
ncbi:hypothetical protein GMOD_00004474 [Pyrenophora seminiperda CCB06]|uniref:Uncharacterized protein n=1 Tax=Pyrenophora seminiperda CCB06 TaxID=1302712 RepID=A0A3M7M1D6_9PLEO|nr:hypothetical protein GMOD_00004474 [Pyrenophora seminiperda CCB06]